jgi:UDP-glucose 4-epimerase
MKMLDAIERGEPLQVYGDGSQAYDFVYVGDCARANLCAMRAETVDRFYNVGTGRRTSIRALAEMLLRLTGARSSIEYQPEGLTFVKNRIGSPRRATAEIAFTAEVALEEGLQALIRWRRADRARDEAETVAQPAAPTRPLEVAAR